MTDHGPESICQRGGRCASREPHKAGRHLDQRDELYDGPDFLFQILPLAVRESARKIAREHPDVMPETVDLAAHIEHLRQQVAHVSVDRDRRVQVAMSRALDCEVHGKDIKELETQIHHFSQSERRNDDGRVAALGLLFAVDDLVRQHERGELRADLTVDQLIESLKRSAATVRRAHDRAWKR